MRYTGVWRGQTRFVTLVFQRGVIAPKTLASICQQAGITKGELDRLVRGEDVSDQ